MIINYQFEDARPFWGDLAAVKLKDKYGFIDKKGTMVVKPVYDDISYYNYDNRYIVQLKNKYGYVDSSGKLVIDAIYTKANYFMYGIAEVVYNGEVIFIDTTGKPIKVIEK